MRGVLAARPAELAELQPARRGLLVLGGGVIAVLAITALQRNNLSRHFVSLLFIPRMSRETLSTSKRGNQRSFVRREFVSPLPGLSYCLPRTSSWAKICRPYGTQVYLFRLPSAEALG